MKILHAAWNAMCSRGEEKEKAAKLTVDVIEKIEGELKGKQFFGGESIGYLDIALGWMSYWLPVWEEVGSMKIVDPLQFPALTSWIKNFLEHPVIKDNLPPRDRMIIYFLNRTKVPLGLTGDFGLDDHWLYMSNIRHQEKGTWEPVELQINW